MSIIDLLLSLGLKFVPFRKQLFVLSQLFIVPLHQAVVFNDCDDTGTQTERTRLKAAIGRHTILIKLPPNHLGINLQSLQDICYIGPAIIESCTDSEVHLVSESHNILVQLLFWG